MSKPASEVTKLAPANKAAIQYLFKRACHAVGSRSPVEMSDPAAVARVLGDLFAEMHEEETKWLAELKSCKGWVCDLPEKVGGGTFSYTAINPSLARLQINGNSKWSTPAAVELKDDAAGSSASSSSDRDELNKLMLRFAQEGTLIEVPQGADANATAAAAAGSMCRISLMRDSTSKDQIRVFHVRESHESKKTLTQLISFVQQLHMKAAGKAAMQAGIAAQPF